jgi:hypothetical protein
MFHPGEIVVMRFTGNPDTAQLTFLGHSYTVENGGLEPRRKSALLARVRVPLDPGKYAYEFTDGEHEPDTGHLRVVAAPRDDPARAAEPEQHAGGVQPRRYTGGGRAVR